MTLRFTKTETALERLDQAIARLEKAAASPPALAASVTPMPAERSSVIPDLLGLDDLTRARQDYALLDQASRHVETRLDALADRLQTLIEAGEANKDVLSRHPASEGLTE